SIACGQTRTLDAYPEEILKNGGIHFEFHGGQPLPAELRRKNPLPRAKLGMSRRDIDLPVVAEKVAEEIRLLLAVMASLPSAGKQIAVTAPFFPDVKVVRFDADFLPEFPRQSFLRSFAVVHSSLRELPRVRDLDSLADENFSLAVAEDG